MDGLQLADQPTDWLFDGPADSLADLPIGWLADLPSDWLDDWLSDWLNGWLFLLTDWLSPTDWMTNLPNACLIYYM